MNPLCEVTVIVIGATPEPIPNSEVKPNYVEASTIVRKAMEKPLTVILLIFF